MREQMPQMQLMKRTRQGCLVLLFPGWSTTLCADDSRWPMLFITLPWTVTAVLLSAAAGIPTIRASRTTWNAVIATAFTVRGNAVYSFTSTRATLPHSTSASIPMHRSATRNSLTQPSTTGKLCLSFLTSCATSHIPIMCASSVHHVFTTTTTASARMGLTACGKHSVHSTHMTYTSKDVIHGSVEDTKLSTNKQHTLSKKFRNGSSTGKSTACTLTHRLENRQTSFA
jgi:hypothetical protein